MRKLVCDTETTGLDASIHRIINLAVVELEDNLPTGNYRQWFLNPDRDSDPVALSIHGLTSEFLSDKPRFHEIADPFLDFIGDAQLIIHNADFDVRFINTELRRIARAPIGNRAHCTKCESQKKHGGRSGHKLDDLVRRYGIPDLRQQFGVHGALIDCLLLANVYRALNGAEIYNLDLSVFGIEPPGVSDVTSEGSGNTSGAKSAAGAGIIAADKAAEVSTRGA